jgi:hypothetical protein
MPEIPQLKSFPYPTTKRCAICHPADSAEPPFVNCESEVRHAGTQVVRNLCCPNCGNRDTDIFDTRTGRVMFDHDLDIRAARGLTPKRGHDVG